jgi:hypothetical protein
MQVLTATKYEGKLSKKTRGETAAGIWWGGGPNNLTRLSKKAVALMGWTKELHE